MTRYDWALPITGNPSRAAAITGPVTEALQNLNSMQSGAGDPDDANVVVLGSFWVNTTTGEIRQCVDLTPRTDASIGAAGKRWDYHEAQQPYDGISGNDNVPIWAPPDTAYALELVVLTDTSTSGSSGSHFWSFQVVNDTATEDLLATAWGTDGSGGGGELVAGTPSIITLDQNTDIGANEQLSLVITKTGTPTSLATAKVRFILRGCMRSV